MKYGRTLNMNVFENKLIWIMLNLLIYHNNNFDP